MGLIARVLEFTRRVVDGVHVAEVKGDPGGGANVTADHVEGSGDDSQPLPTDYFAASDAPGLGRKQVTGYTDPLSEKKAGPGEKRIYARKADGTPVCEVWCKNDGKVVINCIEPGATFEITTTGPVIVNSTDIRLGPDASRKVACLGDIGVGSVQALAAGGGAPITPQPVPVPGAGVPVVVKLVGAGSNAAKG